MQVSNRLDSLTSARFFAAIAVVFFHFAGGVQPPRILLEIANYGRAGVSFFFVLSGFILTYNYIDKVQFKGGINYRAFLWARFCRIMPQHVFCLLLVTPICLLTPQPPVVTASRMGLAWFSNLTLTQIYVPLPWFEQMFNAPSWSIATEAAFYLVFPLFLTGLAKFSSRRSSLVVVAIVFYLLETAFTLGWLAAHHTPHHDPDIHLFDVFVSRMPWVRFGEFAVGCCSGLWFIQSRGRLAGRENLLLILAAAALVLVTAFFGLLPFMKFTTWYITMIPGFALLMIALATERTAISPLLRNPVLILLGEASYGLYLLHWIAHLLLNRAFPERVPPGWMLLAVVLCVCASVAMFKWFDVPVRRWLRPGVRIE